MSVLRSFSVCACVPSPNEIDKREFVESIEEKQVVPLYDKNGKKISEQVVPVIIRKPLDKKRLEHQGESYELFTIDNQINSGVSLQEFKGSFLTPDLTQSSALSELAISLLEHRMAEESKNFESNNE